MDYNAIVCTTVSKHYLCTLLSDQGSRGRVARREAALELDDPGVRAVCREAHLDEHEPGGVDVELAYSRDPR